MGKYYGQIGYSSTNETSPGVWTEVITVKNYYGDIIRNSKRWVSGEGVNDSISLNNQISIVADPFAYDNFHNIRYIKWMGALWKVTNIDIQRPRIILTIGGVYNGEEGTTS